MKYLKILPFSTLVVVLLGPTMCETQQPVPKKVARAVPRITEAAPTAAPARPVKSRKLLVFTVTRGFRHKVNPVGIKALEILGKKTGAFEVVVSNKLSNFLPAYIKEFDAICFLNTTGPVFASRAALQALKKARDAEARIKDMEALMKLVGKSIEGKDLKKLKRYLGKLGKRRKAGRLTTEEIRVLREAIVGQKAKIKKARAARKAAADKGPNAESQLKKSFMNYLRRGGGFVGIHAATDTYKMWPAYLEMVGGVFAGHPWTADKTVSVRIADPSHPVNAAFGGENFSIKDEIYQIKGPYDKSRLRVLLRLDTMGATERLTGIKGNRKDNDYAISWIRRHGKGRVFYCSLGHNNEVFWNRAVLGHYLAGIQFALGDLAVDADPSALDPFVGNYVGKISTPDGKPVAARAAVIPDGGGRYRVVLRGPTVEPPLLVECSGRTADGILSFSGKHKETEWTGQVRDRRITAEGDKAGTFSGRFKSRSSKTLPFTGEPPSLAQWTNQSWIPMPDGSMQVGRGNTATKREFGDVRIHLEFRIPLEAVLRGQNRGNSGVYVMDRYEIQLLDSFGLASGRSDCGAIYKLAAPRLNACLPPLQWQTYDITFRAARFGPDGKTVTEFPTMTVLHNGRVIHDKVPMRTTTLGGGASKQGHGKKGPLMLQDHGNPLRFRNVWAVEPRD